ncbi:hypothetical protein AX774_g4888 [Zancudomyces culisetae]|uniref:Uncharacterized protein n=1 Tax=Zancudomyces culisetae TaxID=1213189 RepID=A0A1R1PEQ0_ZANCU|nr:hypothetical protein AX774_g7233 [Zancudomyces culisetae]OMH81641.1 hypothetical protein AX774_g4888 [Zancudomyces culisetae]|eukprot:OMH79352.1 hypothetical protein AX774_g7233 [Zancudomyces culisetae]
MSENILDNLLQYSDSSELSEGEQVGCDSNEVKLEQKEDPSFKEEEPTTNNQNGIQMDGGDTLIKEDIGIYGYLRLKYKLTDHEIEQFINDNNNSCCDEALQRKFDHWIMLKHSQNLHYNENLEKNKNFNNPSIYSKFLDKFEIIDTASNFESQNHNFKPGDQGLPEHLFYDYK